MVVTAWLVAGFCLTLAIGFAGWARVWQGRLERVEDERDALTDKCHTLTVEGIELQSRVNEARMSELEAKVRLQEERDGFLKAMRSVLLEWSHLEGKGDSLEWLLGRHPDAKAAEVVIDAIDLLRLLEELREAGAQVRVGRDDDWEVLKW